MEWTRSPQGTNEVGYHRSSRPGPDRSGNASEARNLGFARRVGFGRFDVPGKLRQTRFLERGLRLWLGTSMRLRPRGGVDGTSVSSVDATSVASTLRRGLRSSSGRSMGSTPQRQPVGLRPHLHPEVGFRSDRGLGPSTGLWRLRPVRSCWVDRGRYRHDPCGSLGSRAGWWRAGHPRASVRRMAVGGLTAICKMPGRAQPGGVVPDRVEEPREGSGFGQSSLGVLSCRMSREWPASRRVTGRSGRWPAPADRADRELSGPRERNAENPR